MYHVSPFSEEQCDLLLNRCMGIDNVPIVDDNGGLTKTVSVEDSFVRDSITSIELVRQKLMILYGRLIRLLDQRKDISTFPDQSYPRSIRLSIRIVDRSLTIKHSGRRPFHTISKQCSFNGKRLMDEKHVTEKESILHSYALPLLHALLLGDSSSDVENVNVTKINLAAVSFADVDSMSLYKQNAKEHEKSSQKQLSTYFSPPGKPALKPTIFPESISPQHRTYKRPFKTNSAKFGEYFKRPKKEDAPATENIIKKNDLKSPNGIDPTVFASLPADVAEEVMKYQTLHQQSFNTKNKKTKGRIESFFRRK